MESNEPRTNNSSPICNLVLNALFFVFRRWLPAGAWMGLIFWLSSQQHLPGPPDPLWRFVFMKTAHFGAYGTLALLYLYALGSDIAQRRWAFVFTLLYAVSDEWHQAFTPGRTPAARDVGIDMAGALVALSYWPRAASVIAGKARSSADRCGPADDAPRA